MSLLPTVVAVAVQGVSCGNGDGWKTNMCERGEKCREGCVHVHVHVLTTFMSIHKTLHASINKTPHASINETPHAYILCIDSMHIWEIQVWGLISIIEIERSHSKSMRLIVAKPKTFNPNTTHTTFWSYTHIPTNNPHVNTKHTYEYIRTHPLHRYTISRGTSQAKRGNEQRISCWCKKKDAIMKNEKELIQMRMADIQLGDTQVKTWKLKQPVGFLFLSPTWLLFISHHNGALAGPASGSTIWLHIWHARHACMLFP